MIVGYTGSHHGHCSNSRISIHRAHQQSLVRVAQLSAAVFCTIVGAFGVLAATSGRHRFKVDLASQLRYAHLALVTLLSILVLEHFRFSFFRFDFFSILRRFHIFDRVVALISAASARLKVLHFATFDLGFLIDEIIGWAILLNELLECVWTERAGRLGLVSGISSIDLVEFDRILASRLEWIIFGLAKHGLGLVLNLLLVQGCQVIASVTSTAQDFIYAILT